MVSETRAAQPFETGGVLLGVRAGRDSWVTTAAHLPPARPTRSHYVVPEGATGVAVDTAREQDSRIGYLGEWHSHPDGGGPSRSDRGVMRTLAWFLPRPQPVLVIVAGDADRYVLSGYASRLLFLLRAPVVATGPLSRP